MLRKSLVMLAIGASALGFAGSAQAATIVWSTPTSFVIHPISCDVSGASRPCAFTATGSFTPPVGAHRVSALFSTVDVPGSPGFTTNFTSASISGSPMTLSSPDGGITEYASTTGYVPLASNTFSLTGFSGGDSTIYGDITFASPEPAAWALMLLGFAGVGGMVRRRRSTTVRAKLAMA